MFKATARYIRVQPRKARLAAGLMRNRSVVEAQQQLSFSQMKAGRCLKKCWIALLQMQSPMKI